MGYIANMLLALIFKGLFTIYCIVSNAAVTAAATRQKPLLHMPQGVGHTEPLLQPTEV